MAIYHFEAKVITRGVGRSVVAASAYASCSQIYNDYDGVQHDYTRKKGCVYSEIFLPNNAPEKWQDRAELWNAVEAAEKSKDSRLARELIVALPVELDLNAWKSILKDFLTENCVDKGMCADVNIHDTDGHNPHAHILLTVRPLDDKGKWQAKTQKEYLCKRGDDEQGFTADEFKSAQADGWEKQYQYFVGKKKIYMPPSEAKQYGYERASKYPKSTKYGRQNPICAEWNSEEQITIWRKAWEDVINKSLEQKNIDERIDCRSFAERGIDEQPTIHEGVTARIIEQRGGVSERCEINRQIRKDNAILRELKALVNKLSETIENTAAKIAEKLESIRNNLITVFYEIKHNKNTADEIQRNNHTIDIILKEYNKVVKAIDETDSSLSKLKTEKSALSPIHIFKHNALSEQIEQMETTLKKLKNRKYVLLDDMGVKSENDVPKIKEWRHNNKNTLENISKRNDTLTEYSEKEKAQYRELKDNLLPEELSTVQEERRCIREDGIKSVIQKLRNTFRNKYDYDIFRDVEMEVSNKLGEKPLSKKSIQARLNHKPQKEKQIYSSKHKSKFCEYER
jgi:hypothetical protein